METREDNNIKEVTTDTVFCDGGNLGHPRVFLTLEENKIECPYCGQIFIKV